MTDTYESACARAADFARVELATGTDASTLADALITQAAAIWAANTGRQTAARELLRVWHEVTYAGD
ncbi:hypothetical protein JYP52_21140 [Nitratireductor aquibiodomus]|uniref:hypothetical protein n=1 Tax=Nitratireductor aquibiodomus TaxID=204799 RepID=UPI0019D3F331|nr:hypothetical protein [Nitratireductor aquibiodomus]MBN7763649.1 hypothetical protein [Nitratireductor aquibiodomus]